MPIHISWENVDQTIMMARFISPWTSKELICAIDEGVHMITSVTHKVDVIIDFRNATAQVPIHYLPAVRRINEIGLLNRGIMVVIGAPYFIQVLTKLAQEFAPVAYSNLHFALNFEAAYVILEQQKQK